VSSTELQQFKLRHIPL